MDYAKVCPVLQNILQKFSIGYHHFISLCKLVMVQKYFFRFLHLVRLHTGGGVNASHTLHKMLSFVPVLHSGKATCDKNSGATVGGGGRRRLKTR